MFVFMRAIIYATLFISIVLVFVPAQLVPGLARPASIGALQIVGLVLVVLGGALAVTCVLTFATLGRGTPAPFDPPRRLVVRGPYRFVRNPMYIGAGMALVGAALFFGSIAIAAYTAVLFISCHLFIIGYEEPTLRRMFGGEYEAYQQKVRRWIPRIA